MRCILIHFVSAVALSASLLASFQADQPANIETSVYLMRVQRKARDNSTCVLLRQDGQFHAETTHRDHIKVMEGSLPGSEMLKVHQMLDSDGVQKLTSENVLPPRTNRSVEISQISIFRTDHWQNLIFRAGKDNQTAALRSLNPLLKWVDSLPRQSHRDRSEDESNNCQSPKKIELKTRP